MGIPKLGDRGAGEMLVRCLGLLQANHVRLGQPGELGDQADPQAHRVDVPGHETKRGAGGARRHALGEVGCFEPDIVTFRHTPAAASTRFRPSFCRVVPPRVKGSRPHRWEKRLLRHLGSAMLGERLAGLKWEAPGRGVTGRSKLLAGSPRASGEPPPSGQPGEAGRF
jgi:hypothetical protein